MTVSSGLVLALCALTTLASAHDGHDHVARSQLPSRWYHDDDVGVAKLFKRQTNPALQIGSPQWVAQYPPVQGVPSTAQADIPPTWLAAYNAAKSANLIPNLPVTVSNPPGAPPVYPNGLQPTDPQVCSATRKCRAPGDIWDAPDGMIGISFDDGPVAVAPTLYQFLRTNNIPSTHFMIGRVILGDLEWFNIAYQQNQASIAVHTWSHPLMTTQTDMQQLVEIGWTMQIIHDLTGGRVPRYWRPPLGDCDLRCRAIAKNVFNLTTVMWNQDTEDWSLASGGTTGPFIQANLTNWLNGPKHPGLIILEHELTPDTIAFFMNTTYPLAVKNNWTIRNIPDLFAEDWYQNAKNDQGTTTTSLPIALPASVVSTGSGVGTGSVVTTAPAGNQTGGSGGNNNGASGSSTTSGAGATTTTGAAGRSAVAPGAGGEGAAGAMAVVAVVVGAMAVLL